MKTYHVVFKVKEEDFFSTGRNFEAKSPEQALELWRDYLKKENIKNAEFKVLYEK